MLDEEVKIGEQERENLRIEAQRLRDELSDLRIESDIVQEKLKAAEAENARSFKRTSHFSDSRESEVLSPGSEGSVTSASLASALSPERPISDSSLGNGSDAITPPSPPLSEQSGTKHNMDVHTPANRGVTLQRDPHLTPKPTASAAAARAIRTGEKARTGPNRPPPIFMKPRTAVPRPPRFTTGFEGGVPRSESLHQIRGLIGKMQKLEQRVHSARSKLPGPTNTPPRASPRGNAGNSTPSVLASELPSNVTVRSSRKRASASTSASTSRAPTEDSVKRLNHQHSSLPFGRPASAADDRIRRPASRASNNGFARPNSRVEAYGRPPSAAEERRPRSSLAGRATPSYGHRPSLSMPEEADKMDDSFITPTARRMTEKGMSSIPAPASLARRQSSQALANGTTPQPARRQSIKQGTQGRASGIGRPSVGRKSLDLGETF